MTRFFLDDRGIEVPSGSPSLYQILRNLESVHVPPGRGIRQIEVDGLPLMAALSRRTDPLRNTRRCEKIEIFTDPVAGIARDSISEAIRCLDEIEAVSYYATTGCQAFGGRPTFEDLKVMVEVFCWLGFLVNKLESDFCNHSREGVVRVDGQPGWTRSFGAALERCEQARGKEDLASARKLLEEEVFLSVPALKERLNSISRNMSV